jgi:hypothetical protein
MPSTPTSPDADVHVPAFQPPNPVRGAADLIALSDWFDPTGEMSYGTTVADMRADNTRRAGHAARALIALAEATLTDFQPSASEQPFAPLQACSDVERSHNWLLYQPDNTRWAGLAAVAVVELAEETGMIHDNDEAGATALLDLLGSARHLADALQLDYPAIDEQARLKHADLQLTFVEPPLGDAHPAILLARLLTGLRQLTPLLANFAGTKRAEFVDVDERAAADYEDELRGA